MTALIVVGMIVLLLTIDVLVVARRRRGAVPARAPEAMHEPRPPHGLFLDPAHAWVRLHSDGSLRIGVDDFLAGALGELDGIEAAPLGSKLTRGAPLATLRVRGRKLTLRAPADGELVAVNQNALQSPAAVAHDPYGIGWLVGIWPRDHKQALAPLFVGSGAAAFLRQELQRLAEFFGRASAANGSPVMADGGVPLRGAVSHLSDADLARFEEQFLNPGEVEATPSESEKK